MFSGVRSGYGRFFSPLVLPVTRKSIWTVDFEARPKKHLEQRGGRTGVSFSPVAWGAHTSRSCQEEDCFLDLCGYPTQLSPSHQRREQRMSWLNSPSILLLHTEGKKHLKGHAHASSNMACWDWFPVHKQEETRRGKLEKWEKPSARVGLILVPLSVHFLFYFEGWMWLFFSLFFPESPFDCQLLALLVFLGWTSLSVWDVPAAIGLQRFLLLIINHMFLWLFSHQCDANLRLRFEHKWTWCPQEWCKDRVCQCWRERKKEWKKSRDTVSRKGTRGLWAPRRHTILYFTLY